jgi:cytochrome c2
VILQPEPARFAGDHFDGDRSVFRAMVEAGDADGLRWTRDTLDAFLADPPVVPPRAVLESPA